MKRRFFILLMLFFCLTAATAPPAHANPALLARGVSRVLTSAFQIPISMLQDSTRVLFPFGLVTGAVRGTVRTLGGMISGASDLIRGGAPYAKYAALAL